MIRPYLASNSYILVVPGHSNSGNLFLPWSVYQILTLIRHIRTCEKCEWTVRYRHTSILLTPRADRSDDFSAFAFLPDGRRALFCSFKNTLVESRILIIWNYIYFINNYQVIEIKDLSLQYLCKQPFNRNTNYIRELWF